MTDKKPAWQRPHKTRKQDERIADLRAAIQYAVSPSFPAPNDDAARMSWLRAWWSGEQMRAPASPSPEKTDGYTKPADHILDGRPSGGRDPAGAAPASQPVAPASPSPGLDKRPDNTGLDDGPYLPGEAPRKKQARTVAEEPPPVREDNQ